MDSEISENIKVYVRERPYLETETTEIDKISSVTGSKDGSVSYSSNNNFKFDSFFHSQSTQDEIYELSAKPIVESNKIYYVFLVQIILTILYYITC
jgi:hypothetical protein